MNLLKTILLLFSFNALAYVYAPTGKEFIGIFGQNGDSGYFTQLKFTPKIELYEFENGIPFLQNIKEATNIKKLLSLDPDLVFYAQGIKSDPSYHLGIDVALTIADNMFVRPGFKFNTDNNQISTHAMAGIKVINTDIIKVGIYLGASSDEQESSIANALSSFKEMINLKNIFYGMTYVFCPPVYFKSGRYLCYSLGARADKGGGNGFYTGIHY